MNKIRVFAMMSVCYWKQHLRRFFLLFLTIVVGTSALLSMALLVRSKKNAELDTLLNNLGDYDYIAYNACERDYLNLKKYNDTVAVGRYYNIGKTSFTDNYKDICVAAFDNETSENIYHKSCTYGRYPKAENEIAIDISIAQGFGGDKAIGSTFDLKIIDQKGKELEKQSFVLVGIYELTSKTDFKGSIRYPVKVDNGRLELPLVFVADNWIVVDEDTNNQVVFVQTQKRGYDVMDEISSFLSDGVILDGARDGRQFAYASLMGSLDYIYINQGDISADATSWAIDSGYYTKDFYSSVMIPVFAVIICIFVVITINSIVTNVIGDRKSSMGILTALGVKKTTYRTYLFFDLLAVVFVSFVIGLGVGLILHFVTIHLLNVFLNTHLTSGLVCLIYVRIITVNPFLLTSAVIGFSFLVTYIWKMLKFNISPLDLLKETDVTVLKRKKLKIKRWRQTITPVLDFFDYRILFMTIVIMGVAALGYTYMSALSDLENNEYKSELVQTGLENYDFSANRDENINFGPFFIENRHNLGVDKETYESIKNRDEVEYSKASIVNYSSRLSIKKDKLDIFTKAENKKIDGLKLVETKPDNADELEQAIYESIIARNSAVGYGEDEMVYSTPTVGLEETTIRDLMNYTVKGQADLSKVLSGEEVILVCEKKYVGIATKIYENSFLFDISDILLNSEDDKVKFEEVSNFDDYFESVYKKNIITDDNAIEVSSYKIGEKVDIDAKISCVVCLDENEYADMNLFPNSKGYLFFAFGEESFSKWGLPDRKYSHVWIKTKETSNKEQFNDYWYEMLSSCEGIKSESAVDIYRKIRAGFGEKISLFYIFIIMIIILGFIGVYMLLQNRIITKQKQLSILRAIGIKDKQIISFIFGDVVIYTFIGMVTSIVPVSACQRFFSYIQSNVEAGVWKYTDFVGVPWYIYVPYRYNLFEYGYIQVVLSLWIMLTIILFIMVALQLKYLHKKSIYEGIRNID